MTGILGISAFYHDSSAALVIDGRIVAAAQQERFSRRKHDPAFPQEAIDYCLSAAGLQPADLDYVVFYEKPIRKFERLLETYLAYVPSGFASFRRAVPLWLKEKLFLPRAIRAGLRGQYRRQLVFTEHHESHAASAFFPSPFDEATIVTLDGVGEWSTTCIGQGQGHRLKLLHELRFPHSLGLLYSAFTYYTGFRVNSGEYKLMGLAPYGQPVYKDLILERLMDLKPDGSFRMDMSYFNYCQGLTMTSARLHRLFGSQPRPPESELTQQHMDLAASVQAVTEEVVLRTVRFAHEQTGGNKLAMAGGVALNCVANGRVLREGPFDDVWIQPAAGDAGGALGAALFVWHQLLGKPRHPAGQDSQQGSFLGPAYSDSQIREVLDREGAIYHRLETDEALCKHVAQLLARQHVVGWFQGRMEFGPRALGGRSILGDARSEHMQSVMNLKIKFRESFRPFAPIVLREHAHHYFDLAPNHESPYMLLVAPVQQRMRVSAGPEYDAARGLDKLRFRRSCVPAVTHVDYSARIQTVDSQRHPLLHKLLGSFHDMTDCPVLVNTSFNVRGEPIVCTPEEAYRCFLMTDMDALALGHQVLLKSEQPTRLSSEKRDDYLSRFTAD